jgi:hypothetical protein
MAALSSDDVMASVTALARKATLLTKSGHYARAAEKFAAAAATARSLQQPDCLIEAHMQTAEVSALSSHAHAVADATKTYERMFCVLLPAIMATLLRRKAAGTLLPGLCRAAEVSFFGDVERFTARTEDAHLFDDPAFLAELGSVRGYAMYLEAAGMVVCRLLLLPCHDVHVKRMMTLLHPSLDDDQLAAPRAFVLSALALVQQPCVASTTVCISGEAYLVNKCQKLLSNSAIIDAQPSEWAQQLRDVLQRLERTGLMQQRGMLEGLARSEKNLDAASAAAVASAAMHGLRCCALSSCGAREAHVSHYKMCAACKAIVYCSKAHQAEDWPAHKASCKAARKAAAAEAGGASGA